MSSINDFKLDFNDLEKEVYDYVCKLGVKIIEEFMKATDIELRKDRNKDEYRHKGLKQNTIKTIMGPVEYRRAIYENIDKMGIRDMYI